MSTQPDEFLTEFHWLMDVLQSIDVGLVVLNKDMEISLWNSFMQNHSAHLPTDVLNRNLFEVFPDLPEQWLSRKIKSVSVLQTMGFTTWEERPYLFKFKNYRPVTGRAEFMYQNCTIIPISNSTGVIERTCLIIYDVTEVAVNRLQLQKANQQLHQISRSDGLTGLLNRKTWEDSLIHEFKRYQRYAHTCTLIMFDIDHFKNINDTYGHPAGDEVIRQTAEVLRNCTRTIDITGRYGGEEFTVIVVDTDAEGSLVVAERIRTTIEALTVEYAMHTIKFTVSLGITELSKEILNHTMWIESADKGLYEAKNSGRNTSKLYKL